MVSGIHSKLLTKLRKNCLKNTKNYEKLKNTLKLRKINKRKTKHELN